MNAVSRFMTRRPLVLAAACYALGAALGHSAVPAWVWGALMTLGGALFLWTRRMELLFSMLLVLGAWAVAALSIPLVPPSETGRLSGRAVAVRLDAEKAVVTLDNAALDGRPAHTRVQLYLYADAAPAVGDQVSCDVSLWPPKGRTNPGGFDFSAYLRRSGIGLCASASEARIAPGGMSFPLLLERLRTAIGGRLDALFPEHAPIARSILLSDKSMLPDDLRAQFANAGVAHLLAVSGLHISCLALVIEWLLRRLGMRRAAAFLTTLPLLAAYACVVGLPASAVRALIMYLMAGLARMPGSPYDPLTGLAAALMVLLAQNPLRIADPGLILSFSAVAGILALYPTLRQALRPWKYPRPVRATFDAMLVSLSAQMGALGATCCLFGVLTPYAPLTNLPAVPLCTLALPLTALAAAVSALSERLAAPIAALANLPLEGLSRVTAWTAELPGAVVYAPAWPAALVAAYFLTCLFASPYVRRSLKARLFTLSTVPALLAASMLLALFMRPSGLAITFLDAGQADAAVVSAEGRTYLVDVGTPGGPTPDYLRYTGRSVDGVFLSHGHADHAGGLTDLLLARDIPILYLPSSWSSEGLDPGIAEAVSLARMRGTQVRTLSAGDEVALSPGVVARVLAPQREAPPGRGNADSMLLCIEYGKGAALMTGDLPQSAEPVPTRRVQLIKAAHHGGSDATSALLLRACAPAALIISVGRNAHGHPSPAVLDRIEAAGARSFRTDQSGAIMARIHKDGTLEMETYR